MFMLNKIFSKRFIILHTQKIISSNNSLCIELELHVQIIVFFFICFLFDSLFVCLRARHDASITLIFHFCFFFPFLSIFFYLYADIFILTALEKLIFSTCYLESFMMNSGLKVNIAC